MSGAGDADLGELALPPDAVPGKERLVPFHLGEGRRRLRRFAVYAGGDDARMPPTFEEFAERFIADEERSAIVYEIVSPSGRRSLMAPIIIPEGYAQSIESDALKQLVRLQPADLPPLLAELPDPNLIAAIVLRDDGNPEDHWHRRARGAHFVSGAAVSPQGELVFYRGCCKDEARVLLKHEWAHLLHWHLAVLPAFSGETETLHFLWKARAAALAETDGFFLRDLARLNEAENFAVHMGECFLASDPGQFVQFVKAAPVRSSVYADVLVRALRRGPRGMPYDDVHYRRVDYVRETAQRPAADALLAAANRAEDAETRSLFASLLALYGGDEGCSRLTHPADFRLADDPFVRAATIERISRAPRVDALDIAGARGVARALALLAGTGIRRLRISRAALDDAAAGPISRLRTLTQLIADGTNLSDEAIPHLARLRALEDLDVAGTRISDDGANALRHLLPDARVHS